MTTQDDAAGEMRARLLAAEAEAVAEIENLRGRLEARGSYSLGEGDPMIYQWEFNLAMLERTEQHLAEIREALAQLEQGRYGQCEVCGEPIDPERLAVLPHTRTCSRCAEPKSASRRPPGGAQSRR
ncbi:MAG TPA: TraR/DksA C4-type zinc finger protein [Anaerolineae bacterium]